MPKKSKNLCVDDLRHAEYYGMQPVFDELYRRSMDGETFTDLMDLILSRDNILLAYRNIKANGGSYTAGTDNRNISDIGCLPPETVVEKGGFLLAYWCCTIKVDIENSKGQYIEKDKQEATKDGSESTKIQHGI